VQASSTRNLEREPATLRGLPLGYHSALDASRAPSTRLPNLAQAISGSTLESVASEPRPQSVLTTMFSRPTTDFLTGGSDRLVDAIVAWGDAAAVARRVREHLDGGAGHVLLQRLGDLNQGPSPTRASGPSGIGRLISLSVAAAIAQSVGYP